MCVPTKPYKIEREWIGPGGLQCAVTQATPASYRCGYVRVPPAHPLYGKDTEAVECLDVYAHGTVNFAELEPCTEHQDGQGWWFGFDCGHFNDAYTDPDADPETMTEGQRAHFEIFRRVDAIVGGHFWTVAEVAEETERLAVQLAAYV